MSQYSRAIPPKKTTNKPTTAEQLQKQPPMSTSQHTYGLRELVLTSAISSLVSSVIMFVVTKGLEVKYATEKAKVSNPEPKKLPEDPLGKKVVAAIRGKDVVE